MTELLCIILGWLLLAVGFIGCFVPILPGPPIAYFALVAARFVGNSSTPTATTLIIAAVVVIVVTILDFIIPAIGAKHFKCSKAGTIGCFIGTIAGLFFLPFGVIIGPFVGALIGEASVAGKNLSTALLGATGALVGFLLGTFAKLLCCGYLTYLFINSIK